MLAVLTIGQLKMAKVIVFLQLFIVAFCTTLHAQLPHSFDCTSSELGKLLPAPGQFMPVPTARDSFWQQTIPIAIRSSYIDNAIQYLDKKWQHIPDSIFAEYKANGNRTNYEWRNFAIRRQLACLVMGEIMEYQGRFIHDIIMGLHSLINETWWGVPAHYPLDHPQADIQVVDLFNAETASLAAWTIYMLHDELEEAEPTICDSIRQEIDRRMLTPCRTKDYYWKKVVNNWNTWICENWLSCVILCETNPTYQKQAIEQIIESMKLFYNGYPDDGGCDEGLSYWDRAAGSFFECTYMLDILTNGKFSLRNDTKLEMMGAFAYKTYIGKGRYVNFSDAAATTQVNVNVLYPFGQYVNNMPMINFAAWIANEANFAQRASTLYNRSGNYPTLSREILFLSKYGHFKEVESKEQLLQDAWLPDLQLMTARSTGGTLQGYYLAAKGGHNDESHNHNDVGNFIVYHNVHPIIIDIGVGTYTSQTFSKQRYELFNFRSAYHNVPLINGCEQQAGKHFKANDVIYRKKRNFASLKLNIATAYPKEAHVEKWQRTVKLKRDKGVEITEDYELCEYVNASKAVLVCCGKAWLEEEGCITIDCETDVHHVYYNSKELSVNIETIQTDDRIINNAWQDRQLYRICLTLRSKDLKGKFSYYIC